jgi:hypothetical protein|tara:strand:+ start:752 stop:1012 length:261 start_codon:yes stop_codon:yes gene_type:complete
MLDYYGSIIKKKDEIIHDIIRKYNTYNPTNIKEIVEDLMEKGEIEKECSVSGWWVFLSKKCYEKVEKEIKERELEEIDLKKINDVL